jgi:hypothetical protein
MKMTTMATLKRMKKNPRRVTIFGAIHSGSTSTKAFHCKRFLVSHCPLQVIFFDHVDREEGQSDEGANRNVMQKWGRIGEQYPWAQNVFRHWRFIDARVFVRLQMDQGIVRDALGNSLL